MGSKYDVTPGRGDWDAAAFFEPLVGKNKLCRKIGMRFCRVSGLQGLEDALDGMINTQAFFAVSEESQGVTELLTTPHSRRVKTVFLAMRHKLDDMEARRNCFLRMNEVFRQMMSVLLRQQTRIAQGHIYIDPKITFTEMESYTLAGCAGAFFQVTVDTNLNLVYNPDEWDE